MGRQAPTTDTMVVANTTRQFYFIKKSSCELVYDKRFLFGLVEDATTNAGRYNGG